MKKTKCIFLLLLLPLLAQSQLLWEISGKKLKQKSYLFGTHHLIPVSFIDSIKGIYPAYNSCRSVVGEIITDDPSLFEKMQKAAHMSTHSIQNLYSENDFQKADSILKSEMGAGLEEMAMFKPAMIENIYLLTLYEKHFAVEKTESQMDSFFQKIAKENGKKIVSLETIDEQIALLLKSKSIERQAETLYGTLLNSKAELTKIRNSNELYKKGDLAALLEMSQPEENCSHCITEEELKTLLDNRNKKWAKKLPVLMKKEACFIAVGALHLPGENGLIQLLKKAGYKVKAVK